MPVSFISRNGNLAVYVWELTEDREALYLQAELTLDEQQRYLSFRSESRQQQWLAVRALVNKILGKKVPIEYDEEGRPSINHNSQYISISHTGRYVAVLLGTEPHIGLDIEGVERSYQKIAHKFVDTPEASLFLGKGFSEKEYLPLIWSAKEAAFKAALQSELDFIRDITVTNVTTNDKHTMGEIFIRLNRSNMEGSFRYYTLEDHVIVWGEYGRI